MSLIFLIQLTICQQSLYRRVLVLFMLPARYKLKDFCFSTSSMLCMETLIQFVGGLHPYPIQNSILCIPRKDMSQISAIISGQTTLYNAQPYRGISHTLPKLSLSLRIHCSARGLSQSLYSGFCLINIVNPRPTALPTSRCLTSVSTNSAHPARMFMNYVDILLELATVEAHYFKHIAVYAGRLLKLI